MIHSLYRTMNLVNNKTYIGVHQEQKWPVLDDYLGSGKLIQRAIKKYGIDNFKREILCIADDREYILLLESLMVTEEFIIEDSNYNLAIGGAGSPGGEQSQEALLAHLIAEEKRMNMECHRYVMGKHKERWLKAAATWKENNYGIKETVL